MTITSGAINAVAAAARCPGSRPSPPRSPRRRRRLRPPAPRPRRRPPPCPSAGVPRPTAAAEATASRQPVPPHTHGSSDARPTCARSRRRTRCRRTGARRSPPPRRCRCRWPRRASARALRRAEPELGGPTGAYVVADRDRQAGALGDQIAEGDVAPADVLRPDRDAALVVDDAGHGHADGPASPASSTSSATVSSTASTAASPRGVGRRREATRSSSGEQDRALHRRAADVESDDHLSTTERVSDRGRSGRGPSPHRGRPPVAARR